MNTKTGFIYLTVTFVILTAGFFLPDIISEIQDRGLGSQVSRYEAINVQFNQPANTDILENMRLASGDYAWVDLQKGDKLDGAGASAAAGEALAFFADALPWKIEAGGFTPEATRPFLVVDEERTALLWACVLTDEYGNTAAMLIDDESGMMVSFKAAIAAADQTSALAVYVYSSLEQAEKWADTCARYYGFALVETKRKSGDYLLIAEDRPENALLLTYSGNAFGFNTPAGW